MVVLCKFPFCDAQNERKSYDLWSNLAVINDFFWAKK